VETKEGMRIEKLFFSKILLIAFTYMSNIKETR
jgi:hypothetical protein